MDSVPDTTPTTAPTVAATEFDEHSWYRCLHRREEDHRTRDCHMHEGNPSFPYWCHSREILALDACEYAESSGQ